MDCTKIKIVLWDLDGTLAYWNGLGIIGGVAGVFIREFAGEANPVRAALAIARAYKRVLFNPTNLKNDPLFNRLLAASLNRSPGDIRALSKKLIQSGALAAVIQTYIRPIPEARHLVGLIAREQRFLQVVATNPIMPSEFNARRLALAGYDCSAFKHITGSEWYSRQKNQVVFYRELLQFLKAAPEQCLMVGNDMAKDAIATMAGIPFFMLENQFTKQGNSPAGLIPDAQGSYETLRTFLALPGGFKD